MTVLDIIQDFDWKLAVEHGLVSEDIEITLPASLWDKAALELRALIRSPVDDFAREITIHGRSGSKIVIKSRSS